MSGHQHATVGDTVYFWFASNDTSGSGDDGATPLYDVREAGATAGAAPLLSGTPTLLTHANYPAGCHEISVAATVGNGFAADDTFAVFCTLAVDSQNPTGFVGSCTLTPIAKAADLTTVDTVVDGIQTDLDNGTDGLGALKALLDTIEGQTDDIGVAGAGLTAVPWNSAWDAEVQSECADALTAYDPPTKAELDSGFAALNDPTAAAIADAVWDELQADHTTAATFGVLASEIASILVDTGALDADWADGGRLDLLIDAIKAVTDQMVFTKANELDVNTQSINGAGIVGDGNATPWDGE